MQVSLHVLHVLAVQMSGCMFVWVVRVCYMCDELAANNLQFELINFSRTVGGITDTEVDVVLAHWKSLGLIV